jgi:hypothetical protein
LFISLVGHGVTNKPYLTDTDIDDDDDGGGGGVGGGEMLWRWDFNGSSSGIWSDGLLW